MTTTPIVVWFCGDLIPKRNLVVVWRAWTLVVWAKNNNNCNKKKAERSVFELCRMCVTVCGERYHSCAEWTTKHTGSRKPLCRCYQLKFVHREQSGCRFINFYLSKIKNSSGSMWCGGGVMVVLNWLGLLKMPNSSLSKFVVCGLTPAWFNSAPVSPI